MEDFKEYEDERKTKICYFNPIDKPVNYFDPLMKYFPHPKLWEKAEKNWLDWWKSYYANDPLWPMAHKADFIYNGLPNKIESEIQTWKQYGIPLWLLRLISLKLYLKPKEERDYFLELRKQLDSSKPLDKPLVKKQLNTGIPLYELKGRVEEKVRLFPSGGKTNPDNFILAFLAVLASRHDIPTNDVDAFLSIIFSSRDIARPASAIDKQRRDALAKYESKIIEWIKLDPSK